MPSGSQESLKGDGTDLHFRAITLTTLVGTRTETGRQDFAGAQTETMKLRQAIPACTHSFIHFFEQEFGVPA